MALACARTTSSAASHVRWCWDGIACEAGNFGWRAGRRASKTGDAIPTTGRLQSGQGARGRSKLTAKSVLTGLSLLSGAPAKQAAASRRYTCGRAGSAGWCRRTQRADLSRPCAACSMAEPPARGGRDRPPGQVDRARAAAMRLRTSANIQTSCISARRWCGCQRDAKAVPIKVSSTGPARPSPLIPVAPGPRGQRDARAEQPHWRVDDAAETEQYDRGRLQRMAPGPGKDGSRKLACGASEPRHLGCHQLPAGADRADQARRPGDRLESASCCVVPFWLTPFASTAGHRGLAGPPDCAGPDDPGSLTRPADVCAGSVTEAGGG